MTGCADVQWSCDSLWCLRRHFSSSFKDVSSHRGWKIRGAQRVFAALLPQQPCTELGGHGVGLGGPEVKLGAACRWSSVPQAGPRGEVWK